MKPSPIADRVRAIAADILQVPASSVSLQSSPETVESWDSVRHLDLVLALEQAFNLQFEPEEIDQMKNIERIVDILSAKAPAS